MADNKLYYNIKTRVSLGQIGHKYLTTTYRYCSHWSSHTARSASQTFPLVAYQNLLTDLEGTHCTATWSKWSKEYWTRCWSCVNCACSKRVRQVAIAIALALALAFQPPPRPQSRSRAVTETPLEFHLIPTNTSLFDDHDVSWIVI